MGTATVSTSPSGWSICRNTAPDGLDDHRARGRVPRREMELVVRVDLAAGHGAQVHRRRTAPPDVRDAIDDPAERLGLADAHRRVVPEPGGEHRIGERGPLRRPDRHVVARGRAPRHADRGPSKGVDHHADARAVVDLDPDRHAEARIPPHVACRPVERVEHPPNAGRTGPVRALLAEDRIVGPRAEDPLDDRALGRPVDLGDEVARRGFLTDREPVPEPVPLDLGRPPGEPHRERQELVERIGRGRRAQGSMTLPNRTSRAGTRAIVSSLRRTT